MSIVSKTHRHRSSFLARVRGIPAYFKDPAVPFYKKGLVVLALIYVISPVDAIPDVIPIFGWLDDIGVIGILIGAMMRELDRHNLREASEL